MRAFSTILVAITLALSANAAAIDKRDISAPVQLCIDDINAVAAQLAIVKTAVDAFTSSSGFSGALAINSKEQTLETLLKKAGTDCCVTPPTSVSDEEAQAVLGVVSSLVPQVTGSLASISAKKSQFDAIFLATGLVKTAIKNLNAETVTLDTCLINKTPAAYLDTANGYVTQINSAFASAKSTYAKAAALHNKREVSSPVQMCIDSISEVNVQRAIVKDTKVLEDKLKKASGGCCAISATTVTDEEATAAFSVVGGFVPQVHSALASITKQKSQFDSIPPAAGIYNRAINKLNDDAESLMKCLLDNTPANSLPIANDYVSRVNSAIAEAKNNF